MVAKCVRNEVMDEEWLFSSWKELKAAAMKEACVCGDSLRIDKKQKSMSIYNWHQDSIRWTGKVKYGL